ncbi:TetR family transcriptional regulator [Cellulomonas chitinilytica]|uniref:TetR family transcriptional regulator n=1 Tax=Cellulomonas chitinilytica TaxID=398759 RepID=A0A919P5G6_9CELL|nr:TetR/AcrR family transcriptional regulator [Cellulomonas chitinilytica]GIG21344.1 TetR family transcriptional regulator [Cellulomonas chitinilytica]
MGRWEPDAQNRLREAALSLFADGGYERTTVAEIARAAGVTERTFFRHFADKREVLFDGQARLQDAFVGAVTGADHDAAPLAVVAAALDAAAAHFPPERREFSRQRGRIIAANPGLQERELLKLATLTDAMTEAFRRRGLAEPAASLSAHTAVVTFHVAFTQWTAPDEQRSFVDLCRSATQELRALTAG